MMDFSLVKRSGLKLLPVLLTLTAVPGARATALLTVTPSTGTLTCSTATGTTPITINVKSVAAPGAGGVVVTWVTGGTGAAGLVVTPATQTISTAGNATGVNFTVTAAPGCVGVTSPATPTVTFKSNGTTDVGATITTNVANGTTNPLAASPSPVTVTCVYDPTANNNNGGWTPGNPVTVSVTSPATGGTPLSGVTLANFGGNADTSLTLGTIGGASPATSTPATFTVQAAAGCGGYTATSNGHTVVMAMGGVGTTKNLTVNMLILPKTPMQASPSAPTVTYVKTSGSPGYVDISVTSINVNNTEFFAIDTSTMPSWLTASSFNGTTPKSIRFSTTNVGDTLAPGTYSASVHLDVSNYGDLVIPITMLLTNPAPKLSVAIPAGQNSGTNVVIPWIIGSALPAPVVTAVSSDTPIPFTVTTAGTLGPVVPASELSGLAYSFGTPINVSFNPLVFASATPNSTLNGTVTLTYGNPAATIVVTYTVNVISPGATVSGVSPASIPTALPTPVTTFTLTLTGTGFITGSDPTKRTTVGIVAPGASNNALTADTNISYVVSNASNIILTITVPANTDPLLPFSPTASPAGGSVVIGVCNPVNGNACPAATGTATLTIGAGPIIQAITSSSTLVQFTPPSLPSIAPYDMISIFGSNFCSQSGSGCSTNSILYGNPDPILQTYPTVLTPDTGNSPRNLSVTFYQHGTNTSLGAAPLLFATNGQINALVPSGVASKIGSTIDVVVSFGTKSSAAFVVNCVASDPGLFTIGADGQGASAALDSSYTLISSSNPAGLRTGGNSDTISIYLTGLGAPDSIGADNGGGGQAYPGDCASTTAYLGALNSQTGNNLLTLDGALLNPIGLGTGDLVPCMNTTPPTITFGGVAGTVTYAGWVASTVAGLYQINATLPSLSGNPAPSFTDVAGNTVAATGFTHVDQLPVVITSGTVTSQTGVFVSVQQRLAVAPPAAPLSPSLVGAVGNPWTGTNNAVTATQGTAPYRYTITSGLLPPGLTMSSSTGVISGSPNANTIGSYTLTVTATDSSVPVPLTGKVTFTLVVGGGVYLTHTAPTTSTFGTANAAVTTETPTTGISPYTYTTIAGGSNGGSVTGLSTNNSTGVVSTSAATPAGNYNVTVTATDATAGTALMGSDTYPIVVKLKVVLASAPTTVNAGSAGAIASVNVTGETNSSNLSYTLDPTTVALGWVAIDASGNITVTTSSAHGTYPVTVTVADSGTPSHAASGGTGTVTFTMNIN